MHIRQVCAAAFSIALVTLFCLGCGDDEPTNPGGNTAPTASFTVDPTSGTAETAFQLDASGSSDAQDPVSALQVRWDWENDQTWDTEWSTTKTTTHQYTTTGEKTIRLQVKDTGALSDDTTRTVSVGVPLSLTVVFPNGGENWVGASSDTVKWTWTGSVGNVKIEYTTDGGSAWSTALASTSNSGAYPWRAPNMSSTTCRVKVSSVSNPSVYDMSDADFTITFQNTAPTAYFTVSTVSGTVDTVFQFDASESFDAEDPLSALQVRWDWENDGTWDTDWSDEKIASHQYATLGTKTVKLVVKDTGALTDDATGTVMVGIPPSVVLTSPANGATDISPYPTVEVWFSQALDVASIDTLDFHIDRVPSRAIFYDTIERKAILYPSTILAPLTQHEVHLGPDIMSDAGLAMGQEVIFGFTTGPLDCEHLRDRFEPNDDIASATQTGTDGFYPGLTSCGGAERFDFYRFTLTQTQKIRVTTEAAYVDTQSVVWKIKFRRDDGLDYASLGTQVYAGGSASSYYTFLPGTYWIEAGKYDDDSHLVVYHLIVEELAPAPDDQYEDNDFPDQATPIQPGLYEGLRGARSDADYYSLDLTVGQTITVTATEVTTTYGIRRLEILDANATFLTGHTDTVNPAVEFWTVTTTGTYIVYARWWSDDVIYNLNVEVED